MKMSDADHPIWRLLQTIVYIVALRLFLMWNAETYNEGEQMTMKEMTFLLFGAEGAKQLVKGNLPIGRKKQDEQD